jgi:ABC-type molybdate transport system substrate-binding protein
VQDSVADGEIEVAVGPYLSDMRNPGLNIVGALPPDASTPIDITAWVSSNVGDRKTALALIDYFKSKEVAPIWEEAKVFPVTK